MILGTTKGGKGPIQDKERRVDRGRQAPDGEFGRRCDRSRRHVGEKEEERA